MKQLRQRVLLFGSTGQVGRELAKLYRDHELVALDRSVADLSQPESLRAVVRDARPHIILNAAAYTAVDRAESEPELADLINHRSPAVLAEEARRSGAVLLHYSTDYVFDGSKREACVETDMPALVNVYGATKLAGEKAIARVCRHYFIVRTSWVYAAHGHNFVRTMLRLGREKAQLRIVDDQWGAPTPAALIARASRAILEYALDPAGDRTSNVSGIYHVTCGGKTNWCEFARAIFAEAGLQVEVQGIPSSEYPASAMRPCNSVLSNEKLAENFNLRLPAWKIALTDSFADIMRGQSADVAQQSMRKSVEFV